MLCHRCGSHVPSQAQTCDNCGATLQQSRQDNPGSLVLRRRKREQVDVDLPYRAGSTIAGRYEVRSVLGTGPLGAVYKVVDRDLELDVALKIIWPHLLTGNEGLLELRKVIRRVRKLNNPNIVRIFDEGVDGKIFFYTMQYLEGLTLRKIISLRKEKSQVFALSEIEPILSQIVEALEYAHTTLHHGYLKPQNIIVLPDLLKLTDFGLQLAIPFQKLLEAQQKQAEHLAYLAPEIRQGLPGDSRSDIYSLGVLFAEMLTGQLYQRQFDSILPYNPDVVPLVDTIFKRAIHPDPSSRYKHVADLRDDIVSLIENGELAEAEEVPTIISQAEHQSYVAEASAEERESLAFRDMSMDEEEELDAAFAEPEDEEPPPAPPLLPLAPSAPLKPSLGQGIPSPAFAAKQTPPAPSRELPSSPLAPSNSQAALIPPPLPSSPSKDGVLPPALPTSQPSLKGVADASVQFEGKSTKFSLPDIAPVSVPSAAVASAPSLSSAASALQPPPLQAPAPPPLPKSSQAIPPPLPGSGKSTQSLPPNPFAPQPPQPLQPPPAPRPSDVAGSPLVDSPPAAPPPSLQIRKPASPPPPLPSIAPTLPPEPPGFSKIGLLLFGLGVFFIFGAGSLGLYLKYVYFPKQRLVHLAANPQPAQPSVSRGTEPPVRGTEPPVRGTEPPVRGTEPPVRGTEPPARGTEPPVRGTEPPARGTEPPVRGTEPPVRGTEPPVRGTEPPVRGTEPPVRGTEPPVRGTEPPVRGTEPPSDRRSAAVTPPVERRPESRPPPRRPLPRELSEAERKKQLSDKIAVLLPIQKGTTCPSGMALIKAGSFTMGSSSSDDMKGFGELNLAPRSTKAYCIERYEYPGRGRPPRSSVSWNEAEQTCKLQSKRLCTEEEWERACKGGRSYRFPYGNDYKADACNTKDNGGSVRASGSFRRCKSNYGIYDMSGNVAEWTSSMLRGRPVVRGGGADRPDWDSRCASRGSQPAGTRKKTIGFRCCADPT